MKYFQWNLSYGPLFVPANKWNDSSGYFSVILLKALWLLLSELLLSTARPHHISGQVLSSHSIVLLSRAVRPCSPCVGRWIEKWRTTWSKVCSSAPHSYAAEGAITHVSKQERQRPRAVRRRLRRTRSVLVRVIPGVWVPVSEMKVRSHAVFSNHSAFHWWSAQSAAFLLLLSDELMSSCAAGTNGCLDLGCCSFTLGVQVRAEWSSCPGFMLWRHILVFVHVFVYSLLLWYMFKV